MRRATKEVESLRVEITDTLKRLLKERRYRYINREIVRGDGVITVRVSSDGISIEIFLG